MKLKSILLIAGIATIAASSQAITIADAKALGTGANASLTNVVVSNVTDLISSTNFKSLQLQDATGGITVFGANADIDAILAGFSAGDTIDLSGTTGTFNGLFQLQAAFTLGNVTSGPGIPMPTTVGVADFQDMSATAEGFESTLVKLTNVTFVDAGTPFGNGTGNYVVTDGVNNATVRVSTADLGFAGVTIPSGPVNITGIFSQFDSSDPRDGGYQLQVRGVSDIEAVPEPATMAILGLGVAALARRKRK